MAPEAMMDRRLHVACGIGIGPNLLEHFELSLDSGIGGYVFRYGRILRCSCEVSNRDREIQKEFELLGGQVAIPILDRESIIGVAVFDGRLTGELFANEELELIFHLLEQLGMAIKNSWLHDQLTASYEMMMDVINQLGGGCVVVGRNLEILHANRSARSMFFPGGGSSPGIEFPELPQILAGKIFEVLKTGEAIAPFKHRPDARIDKTLEVVIRPFRRETSRGTTAVLMLVEDISGNERAHKLEIETANLRLVQKIASQLAHEIGNAVVPLSTHQQLLDEKFEDPDFRLSLSAIMSDGVKRINRLSLQLLYLSQELTVKENILISSLLEDAFGDAQSSLNLPEKKGRLSIDPEEDMSFCLGHARALRHALSELFLNALQGNPKDPQVSVNLLRDLNGTGKNGLQIAISDNGSGFAKEAMQNLFRPFFTTRSVGLGLGLAVARTIIEQHHGQLEVPAPTDSHRKGLVIVSMPLLPNPPVSHNPSFFKTNLAQKSPFN
jgi:signal transduction histidine kinase